MRRRKRTAAPPAKPIDVPTRETAAFLSSHIRSRATVLEVGCGDGHVAVELKRLGYRVTGVDADSRVTARARKRGVSAITASWPDYERRPVDAVAFTRSLHHIGPLAAAAERAHQLLKPGGVLLLEDIAFEEVDARALRWFVDVLRTHPERALVARSRHELVPNLLAAKHPIDAWHAHHDHDLHGAVAMAKAIAVHFDIRSTASAPYFYRYLVPVLPKTSKAAALIEDVLREEQGAGARGELTLIGRRIVGRYRS